MIFTLGACVAGLLALLCLPAISRRAMRFAQTAVERQMPISVGEIVAQRDLLRAEFATERRRIEQALEGAREAQAQEMGVSGRRAAEVGHLTDHLATRTGERDAALIAQDNAERSDRETSAENGALQKQLWDADGLEARLREQLAVLQRAHDALTRAEAELTRTDAEKAALIVTLTADRNAKAAAGDALDRILADTKLEVSVARAEIETLHARIDGHEDAGRRATATEAELRRKISDLENAGVADEDIAMLRRTIVEIGHEVVRLAGDGSHAAPVERADADRVTATVN